MKVITRSRDITPEYLKSHGWTERSTGVGTSLWHHPKNNWEMPYIMAQEYQWGMEIEETIVRMAMEAER